MPHRPRKRFGQNFLSDPRIIERVVAAIAPRSGDHLVEIGPGRGALTRALIGLGARLTAIEIDRDLARLLGADPGLAGIELIAADALRTDFRALARGAPIRLLGNLPYNISTPLLFHALEFLDVIADMHFMLQREVVARMAAEPGNKTYGRLSVSLQYHCRVQPLLEIGPDAFRPRPKVDSTLVRLTPRPAPEAEAADSGVLARVLAAAFRQRRKQLHNSLRGLVGRGELEGLGIRPEDRPEDLSVADYVRLANHIAAQRKPDAEPR